MVLAGVPIGSLVITGGGPPLALTAGLGLALFCYLQISWGGDLMRPHLRAVSDVARYACPACGQSLYGHLGDDRTMVQCPECGARVDRRTFAPPYPIAREFRVFPPWRRSGPR